MSIFYLHQGGVRDGVGGSLLLIAWARLRMLVRRALLLTIAVCNVVHLGIVLARLRRHQPKRCLHADWIEAAKFPQRPLILGDKWDF